jgi:phosphoglycerate dehydrogenase-like enzyme
MRRGEWEGKARGEYWRGWEGVCGKGRIGKEVAFLAILLLSMVPHWNYTNKLFRSHAHSF